MRSFLDRFFSRRLLAGAAIALAPAIASAQEGQLTPPQIEREAETSGAGDEPAGEAAKEADESEPGQVRRRVRVLRAGPEEGSLWIGVEGEKLPPALAAQLKLDAGVLIGNVHPDSPAAKAGLQQHDIVLQFGDKKVSEISDLGEAVKAAGEKETDAVVLRGGERLTLKLTPAPAPRQTFALSAVDGDLASRSRRRAISRRRSPSSAEKSSGKPLPRSWKSCPPNFARTSKGFWAAR
jgi:membrane-associated protease RseP (regulator of RpoE activity)